MHILQEAAQIVNNHPLIAGSWAEKEPFCPEDLMLERAGPAFHQSASRQAHR
jgi:hypothetical protein